jgi:hypothetical protein
MHFPADSKPAISSVGHAVSQQHPGVQVPLSSAHMQLVLRLAAASGSSGTKVQSTACCWKGKAAAARGKSKVAAVRAHSSSTCTCAGRFAQLCAGLLLLVIERRLA